MSFASQSAKEQAQAMEAVPSAPEQGTFLQIRTADGEGWMSPTLRAGMRRSNGGYPCERCKVPTVMGEAVARTDSFWSESDGGMRCRYFCMGCVVNSGWRRRERPADWGRKQRRW